MSVSKANLRFNYLYRDAGNFKQYGSWVLKNVSGIDSETAAAILRGYLIDQAFFECEKVPVSRIEAYPHDSALDHGWYEFEGFVETDERSTGGQSVEEFIERFRDKD